MEVVEMYLQMKIKLQEMIAIKATNEQLTFNVMNSLQWQP